MYFSGRLERANVSHYMPIQQIQRSDCNLFISYCYWWPFFLIRSYTVPWVKNKENWYSILFWGEFSPNFLAQHVLKMHFIPANRAEMHSPKETGHVSGRWTYPQRPVMPEWTSCNYSSLQWGHFLPRFPLCFSTCIVTLLQEYGLKRQLFKSNMSVSDICLIFY